jgi:predicted nucleic-acid-binding protein
VRAIDTNVLVRFLVGDDKAQALDWMSDGMDFADALHPGAVEGCDVFLSFDRKFAKSAARRSAMEVRQP